MAEIQPSVEEKERWTPLPELSPHEQAKLMESFVKAGEANLAWSQELRASRNNAPNILNWLDDFPPKNVSVDTMIQQEAQKYSDETYKWKEKLNPVISSLPSEKVAEAAKTAEAELSRVTADTGKPNVDIKQEVLKVFENLWASFPFLKKLFDWFLKMTGLWDKSKDATINSDKIKDPEQWKILDKYGISVNSENPKNTKIITQNWSKVEGMKSPKVEPTDPLKKIEWKDTDQTKPIPIPLNKDGSIDINPDNYNSIDIKDNENGCTISVRNKDGSTDTYVIKSEKKSVAPA